MLYIELILSIESTIIMGKKSTDFHSNESAAEPVEILIKHHLSTF